MFDFIFGLPMHALLVHGIVVLIPLAALAAMGFVGRPGWRGVLRWPVAIGAVLAAIGSWIAAESGEALLVRVSQARPTTTDFALVQTHVDAGYRVRLFATIFAVLVLAACWLVRPPGRDEVRARPLQLLLGVLVVLASLTLIVTVVLAGHAGSAAVWSDVG